MPVPFTLNSNNLLLTISVQAPPPINLRSSYEVSVGFYADDAANTFYQRRKFFYSDATIGSFSTYGLLPNFTHEISTTHFVDSLGSVTLKKNFSQRKSDRILSLSVCKGNDSCLLQNGIQRIHLK